MRLFALSLLLVGCAPIEHGINPRQFLTTCGVDFRGYPDGSSNEAWTQESLSAFEERMINEFSFRVLDPRFRDRKKVCESMKLWKVWLHPDGCWIDRWGRNVCGITDCTLGVVQVGALRDATETPGTTAYAHEMAHVIQRCNATQPPDQGQNADHANWTRDHIYDVVDTLR